MSDSATPSLEARSRRSSTALLIVGLLFLCALLTQLYSGSVAGRYAPDVAAATVDANRAEAPALAGLPGIGPTLAQRIVEERSVRGPYADLQDLASRVDGIGARVAGALDGLVSFSR